MTRLYKKLEAYGKTDFYPFHMPGHKRNLKMTEAKLPFEQDITEIDGFDNLHHAEEILLKAQKDAAELYHVPQSFFSVNGSTAGLLSAVSAAVKKGGKMLVARNCHKSVYHAMYLRDIEPVYLYPPMEPKWGINGGILPEDVENCLKNNEGIQAVLLTSPTYDGVVSDVKQIAEITHQYGIPLIVDEAHGAHFAFSSYFPVSAAYLGADLVIQSLHKTLPSMTQTAVLHRCSDLVDETLLRRFMGIYQSSSPSYILMASMDACVERIQTEGGELFQSYTELLEKTRKRLEKCQNLRLVSEKIKGQNGIYDYDRSKILISTIGTSLSGNTLSEILRSKYHLEMEMAEANYVTALTSVGDTKEGMDRLCQAILEIDKNLEKKEQTVLRREEIPEETQNQLCVPLKQKLRISQAMESETAACLLEQSKGQTAAEFVYLYPPGIPFVTPGEEITGQLLEKMKQYLKKGFSLQGMKDYKNQYIQVVKKN